MKKILLTLLFSVWVCLTWAQDNPVFGEFAALYLDESIVEDVMSQGDDVRVKLKADMQHLLITVRISNQEGDVYRDWYSGGKDLIIKVYQYGERKGETYRVNTTAPYIEYWANGQMFLHLKRVMPESQAKEAAARPEAEAETSESDTPAMNDTP